MTKNVSKCILLLTLFAFLFPACSTIRRGPSKSLTTSRSLSSAEAKLRNDITTYARRYEGTKYQYGGNGPKSFDCSGLTCTVYKKFNIEIPRTSSTQSSVGKRIPIHQAKPGDLVFFRKGSGGYKVNHVALVISYSKDGLRVIHSTSSRGVIVENVTQSSYWKPRLLYVRDVIGN